CTANRSCRSRGAGQSVARAADSMTLVTARGFEIMTTCEDRTSTVVAPARSAMKRCVGGGMVLSRVATTYHAGMSSHAGGPDGWASVATSAGRWLTARTAACDRERSPAKIVRKDD